MQSQEIYLTNTPVKIKTHAGRGTEPFDDVADLVAELKALRKDVDALKAEKLKEGLRINIWLETPFDYPDKEEEIVTEIQKEDGVNLPCLFALLSSYRLLYLKSQTATHILEVVEQRSSSLKTELRLLGLEVEQRSSSLKTNIIIAPSSLIWISASFYR
jgi:hypothetical protein